MEDDDSTVRFCLCHAALLDGAQQTLGNVHQAHRTTALQKCEHMQDIKRNACHRIRECASLHEINYAMKNDSVQRLRVLHNSCAHFARAHREIVNFKHTHCVSSLTTTTPYEHLPAQPVMSCTFECVSHCRGASTTTTRRHCGLWSRWCSYDEK